MASAWAHGHGWARCGAPLRPQLPRHAPVMRHNNGTPFLFIGNWQKTVVIYLSNLLVRYAVARGGLSPES